MLATLKLKPKNGTPLFRQIDAAIRSGIEAGRLKPGERLPSIAELAKQLRVNKLTALKAFRELEKSGLLHSHVGRGTFVSGGEPQGPANAETKPDQLRALRRLREGYARGLRELMSIERRPGTINLAGGVPSPATIPAGLLEDLAQAVVRKNARRLYEYSGPAGLPELREAIRQMLARQGTRVSADEIICTNGSQQAVSLLAAWAQEDGRTVLCETPTFTGTPWSFMFFGHAVQNVAWEQDTLDLEQLRTAASGRRVLAYLCPDFHNPTGYTLSAAARLELAAWARESGACILEDQIFREMRFEGEAPPALYPQLPPGRRFLVGSISKSFMTGLRIGFLVADASVIADLLPFKRYMDLGGPSLIQAIGAAFLTNGYAKHLQRMRSYYRTRRDAALAALEAFMPPGVSWTRPAGGFQLWVTMPQGASSIQLFLQGIERGIAISPGPANDIDGRYVNSFRLGYGHASPADLRSGIRRLAELVKCLLVRGPQETSRSGLGILV